jgi:hypothetical protein
MNAWRADLCRAQQISWAWYELSCRDRHVALAGEREFRNAKPADGLVEGDFSEGSTQASVLCQG